MFRPEKNHLQAVEALSRIREKRKDAKLLFVGGDGETRQRVLNLIAERKLEPHVRLVINPDDVRPYLKAMDVGILCSTTGETFSQAALEMMAMNVPSCSISQLSASNASPSPQHDCAGLSGCMSDWNH